MLARCLSARCLSARCQSARCQSARCLSARCQSAKCLSAKRHGTLINDAVRVRTNLRCCCNWKFQTRQLILWGVSYCSYIGPLWPLLPVILYFRNKLERLTEKYLNPWLFFPGKAWSVLDWLKHGWIGSCLTRNYQSRVKKDTSLLWQSIGKLYSH